MNDNLGGDDRSVAREDRNKHLELVQSVINRLAVNSFLIKGWTLTVSAAFYGYAAYRMSWRVALVALLVPAAFWGLDTYYLRAERLFRHLFDDVRKGSKVDDLFTMDRHPYQDKETRRGVFVSTTLLLFYGPVLAVGIAIVVWGLCRT
jgi:hypothetical protein